MRPPISTLALIAAALLAALPGAVRAQEGGASVTLDPDVDALRPLYEHGRYEAVLERARARLDRGGLDRSLLVTVHKFAGLSAFNLGQQKDAERHFTALLRLDPDFSLDPFAVAPPAIAFFEKLKSDLDPQLDLIRQQQRLEAERLRREAEAQARRQAEEEERRRRLEELSRRVTIRTVERRSFLVNFVPFGAGQFQQGRTAHGVVLAAAEGATALTSIIAYLAYDALIEEQRIPVDTVQGRQYVIRYGIPRDRLNEANTWRVVKYASAGAFYALYAYGVVDAIYNHQDEVVTTTLMQLPPDTPLPGRDDTSPGPPPADEDTVPVGPGPSGLRLLPGEPSPWATRLFLYPTPGGVGAGLTLTF